MSRVQAIAGATGDELEKLTQQAMDLGAQTSFSASEVAEGMENLASAGFTTEEIMSAMPGLLDLAASSGADLATSSEIAASAIRGFGLEASSASHVADVFAEAAARTNAQTEDMGEAMKYIAPVANTMGLKIEEVAAAIGIMSDAGIKGSQAGTSLRGALTRLTKPTDKMLGVMEDLGISFYDNEGKMKSLTEMVSMLQEATKDLTDEQAQNALTVLFGTESLSGMVSLINRGSDDLSDLTKSFEKCDGSASDMADTMLDNTAGALESLSGSLETAGIAIQKALAPEIKELAKWIQGLVDDFSDLSDEEQLNIIKTVALVAAIGPAIKILSKITGTIGTVTKGIGIFSQAVAVATNKTTSNITSVNNLASAFKSIVSPAGLAVTAVGAVTAAIVYFSQKQTDAQIAAEELAMKMADQKKSLENYNQSVQETLDANLAHINSVENLKDELETLVDENGKVKKGYESRVDFILNELNEALGTEYDLNGNVIDSYKELQDEIDELIEKKRAEIFLSSYEEDYKNAIENQTGAVENMKTAYDQLSSYMQQYGTDLDGLKNKATELRDLQKEWFAKPGAAAFTQSEEYRKEAEAIENVVKAYEDAEWAVQDYTDKVNKYTSNYELFVEEKYNEIGKTVTQSTQNWSDASLESIQSSIAEQGKALDAYANIYRETGNTVAQDLANQAIANLQSLAEELTARTSTINELGENEKTAWKELASSSYAIYSEYVSKMGPEMQDKIQEATGVVITSTPEFKEAAGKMGQQVVEEFDKNSDAKQEALKTLQGFYEGLNDKEKKELLKETVGKRADEVAKEFEKGDYETSGKNVLQGIYKGLNNGSLGQSLINKAAGIAKNIANQFNIQWDEHSPSKLMEQKTDYLLEPIGTVFSKRQSQLINDAKNLAESIVEGFDSSFGLDNSINVPNLKNMKYANTLSSNIIHESKTIFTTPQIIFNVQELDEAKLQQCFNYINRKFGSQY